MEIAKFDFRLGFHNPPTTDISRQIIPRNRHFCSRCLLATAFIIRILGRHPASTLSRIMAKTAKNIEKKSLFVSFLTDLAGFVPYHSAIWKSGKAVLRVAVSRRPLTPTERTRNLTGRMDAQPRF